MVLDAAKLTMKDYFQYLRIESNQRICVLKARLFSNSWGASRNIIG